MLYDNSIIINFCSNDYKKMDKIFIKTLLKLKVKKSNIINNKSKDNKLKFLINNIEKYKSKTKYFIFSLSNIWFIENNKNEWKNLELYIEESNHDIYFIKDGYINVNSDFFIIKNNNNISSIITFFNNILYDTKNGDEKSLINKFISKINYGTIPNQYIVNENTIYNEFKALIHCAIGDNKGLQIKNVMEHFNPKNMKNVNNILKNNDVKKKYECEIVVARYNEDISWLKDLPKDIKITVYNKGQNDIPMPYINLPNKGRESHTYLYHIVNNYNNLAEMTIFCQGDSISHNPDFINLIKNRKYFEDVQPLSAYYTSSTQGSNFVDAPPKFMLEATKDLHINGNRVFVEYLDYNFVTQYPHYYYPDIVIHYLLRDLKETNNIKDKIIEYFINKLIIKNVDFTKLIPTSPAALLAIRKHVILDNSVDFYNNIMSTLLYDLKYTKDNKLIDFGLVLEKFWLLIFNYKKYNKNYIDLKINDYLLYETNLFIKNNTINFKIFNYSCYIYLNLYIDNNIYKVKITNDTILLNLNKILSIQDVKTNNNIQNALKDMNNLEINISLKNDILKIYGNKVILLDYKFNYKLNNIKYSILFNISKQNNFVDLNL
jgi:hypothetical protein